MLVKLDDSYTLLKIKFVSIQKKLTLFPFLLENLILIDQYDTVEVLSFFLSVVAHLNHCYCLPDLTHQSHPFNIEYLDFKGECFS